MPKRTIPALTNEQAVLQALDYYNKKAAIKELDSQCKEIRKPLEERVMKEGATAANGSKALILPYADKEVHIVETLRTGKMLLPEAIDVLKENGLEECIENVPTIREDVLERLYDEGKVSIEVLRKIYAEKNTWAFSVNVKPRYEEA